MPNCTIYYQNSEVKVPVLKLDSLIAVLKLRINLIRVIGLSEGIKSLGSVEAGMYGCS